VTALGCLLSRWGGWIVFSNWFCPAYTMCGRE